MKRLHSVLALCLVLVTLIAVSSGQDSVKTEREGYETEVDRGVRDVDRGVRKVDRGVREVDRGVREVDRGVREVDEDSQNDVDMIKRIKRSSEYKNVPLIVYLLYDTYIGEIGASRDTGKL